MPYFAVATYQQFFQKFKIMTSFYFISRMPRERKNSLQKGVEMQWSARKRQFLRDIKAFHNIPVYPSNVRPLTAMSLSPIPTMRAFFRPACSFRNLVFLENFLCMYRRICLSGSVPQNPPNSMHPVSTEALLFSKAVFLLL